MIRDLFIGWLLGITTSILVLMSLVWLISRSEDKKAEPLTKEEWKVM